jgi:hypothetical protein
MTARELYLQRRTAAKILLAQWFRGATLVTVSKGALEPCALMPKGLPAWPIASVEAEELLVASVAVGHRYAGWEEALRQAKDVMRAETKGVERS